jgi:acetoin utilization deacetylase AcuC-like enzyme
VKNIGIMRDPIYMKHSNSPGHPENPKRLEAINGMLEVFPAKDRLVDIPARDATFEELACIHDSKYIKRIERTKDQSYTMLDSDTGANSDSYAAAVRAAGGTIEAIKAVLNGRVSSAFAFVRPPGHHAEADRAMGFCIFNNVAIGACYAIQRGGLNRILIVDWDVHHGNGTMHSFYDSNKVLYFSVHQFPHYPGTGRINDVGTADGKGFTVNVPLPGGQGDMEFLAVFQDVFLPIACEFEPELILVSAGFDTHEYDPLAGMTVSSQGYGEMTRRIMKVAEQCCEDKITFVLEGGYHLTALTEGISSVLQALLNDEPAMLDDTAVIDSYTSRILAEVVSVQSSYWRSMGGT